ncbi:uncharacterized protein LOC127160785, partial [Labeo rohita]|uniref:uncharacterized protein LOC127160785 n=1 Tax=Labeo rohita TaxID=84645 RepID=UPI0021E1C76E
SFSAHLPVPVISSNSSQCSSSSSYCSLVCSVVNVSHVTLSWYKGNSLLSSISVSDLSISLSLPLEIERVDDSYSCVVAYSFTNRTTHLNTELCHTCSDSVHCCGPTEAVIRLVLSALVGVATVILLVYDIRSRRAEQDQAHIHKSALQYALRQTMCKAGESHKKPSHPGVFGKEVLVGDSVTLHSGFTEMEDDEVIQWGFGRANTLIAVINKQADIMTVYNGVLDGRFRDRLKLDKQTGSLTITNITMKHAGRYKLTVLQIFYLRIDYILTVYARLPVPVISSNSSQCSSSSSYCSLVCSVVNVSDVTLSWYKGNSLLSNISVSDLSISLSLPLEIECLDDSYSCVVAYSFTNRTTHLNTELCHTCSDGRLRDRLKLDKQTGSLTITNTTTEHARDYQLQTDKMTESFIVYARLPVPVISSNSSQCSSSSSNCSLVCSAVNVSDVTLSWYKGNSLLSNISVSDLSISLSLPLEIERVDDSYSCVVAYSFTNQTTHLNTELCHTCSDSVHCCGSTEAVIRLVLSALVGVATVILLVYDIRSRRAEQD